jgi:predicted DsbA family dithiol-disulfide isomerase
VSVLTAVYLDFQDAQCYRVWRWLSLLPVHRRIEIRPFASAGGVEPWDADEPTWALDVLALGELARDRGHEAHLAFVDTAFATLHARDQRADADPTNLETFLELGAGVGLDLTRFTEESDRWRAEVGLWHREAEDDLGVEGVPALVFDDAHALRITLDGEVTDPASAAQLLAGLSRLAEQPVVHVVKTA